MNNTPYQIPPNVRMNLPKYTSEEVSIHNKPDDAWIVVNGYVYDVTECLIKHRHNSQMLARFLGTDMGGSFFCFHTKKTGMDLAKHLIGVYVTTK